MAKPIQMPALSPTMTEGKITRWLKKVGDKVSSGEALAEVETDKSNLEIEAYDDGFLISIGVDEGQSAPVGQPIGFIGEKGEAAPAGGAGAKPAAPAPKPKPEAKPQPEAKAPPKAASSKPAAPSGPRATAIPMPALSPTMKEGKITQWLKKEGDKVSSGEAIAEVETDKSTLNIESYDDGILLQIRTKEGESALVGAPIAFVGPKGAQIVEEGGAPPVPSPEEPPAEARPTAPTATKQAAQQKAEAREGQVVPFRREGGAAATPRAEKGGRVFASPLAKRIARERGVDLSGVAGSGPQGRIVKRDVEQAAKEGGARARGVQAPAPAAPAVGRAIGQRVEPKRVEISGLRKVIAQRMTEVKPGVPHFYLSVDIEMDAALEIRDQAKQLDQKVSVNDIIVKAVAVALRKVPKMNVSFAGDHVLQHENADVGIAVAIEDGLITPVIRDADLKGLGQISAESRDFAARAKQRKLRPEEYAGGSITVSNLGMYGIDSFIAVINPPQAAIIAVGGANEKVVVRNGQMVVRKVMTATLSGDHRVIDGALGAVYLKELKELLEHPLRLLL